MSRAYISEKEKSFLWKSKTWINLIINFSNKIFVEQHYLKS